jgi:hypothetical protein
LIQSTNVSVSGWFLAAGVVLATSQANAQTAEPALSSVGSVEEQRAACATGFEQSQVLRRSGELKASRLELLKCVQEICQQAVQNECTRWLSEVEQQMPSVVIAATAGGQDRTHIGIEVDGAAIAAVADGSALELDPGPHTLRFMYGNYPTVQKKLVLRVGEKLRIIEVAFEKPGEKVAAPPKQTPSGTPASPPAPIQSAPLATHRPVPVLSYVLGGVAVASAGAFAYLGLSSVERRKQLERECSPDCSDASVSSLRARLIAADVTAGVGALALVGAVISYVTRPTVKDESKLTGNVNVTPYGLSATAAFRF